MGIATLGGIQFRLDPNSIQYSYTVNYSILDTLGGRVIQVLGSTISDITIIGDFGQDHQRKQESWQLAESFGAQIRYLMDQQVVPPKKSANGGVHAPLRFTFLDGQHNWDFKVLIKSYEDVTGAGSIEHSSGKFSYGYKLTLFLVEDSSLALARVASDKFIARISKGLGWKDNRGSFANGDFQGSETLSAAMDFIRGHSGDGTFDGYLQALVTGQLPDGSQVDPSVGTGPSTGSSGTSGKQAGTSLGQG